MTKNKPTKNAAPNEMSKVYKAKKGSILTDKQAKTYGRRIDQLIAQLGRAITPEELLEDAQDLGSPMHNFFEWDDDIAAQKYRLQQARYILRCIDVEIIYNGDNKSTRAYVNVSDPQDQERGLVYVSVDRALSEPEMRKQLIQQAMIEAMSWKEKYKTLKELGLIFETIVVVKKELEQKLKIKVSY